MPAEEKKLTIEELYDQKCREFDQLQAAANRLANDYENAIVERDALILQVRLLKQQLNGGK